VQRIALPFGTPADLDVLIERKKLQTEITSRAKARQV
jgi:hypothetical protein